ncbi:hypothetical protein GCM10007359_02490 [Rothia aerolata]|uniref:Uncharacterized protein n=1 Tax=Rothia aerolata TaxID=1812262 RepID=A0A917IMU3_9MICC|nr:hypothetical protein GCM10007359_02490 [Rothia aerolata]
MATTCQTLDRWEIGSHILTQKNLQAVAEVTDISPGMAQLVTERLKCTYTTTSNRNPRVGTALATKRYTANSWFICLVTVLF